MMCEEESDDNQENHERDDYIDKLVDEVTVKQAFEVYKKKIEKASIIQNAYTRYHKLQELLNKMNKIQIEIKTLKNEADQHRLDSECKTVQHDLTQKMKYHNQEEHHPDQQQQPQQQQL